jgi:hypothetical protein
MPFVRPASVSCSYIISIDMPHWHYHRVFFAMTPPDHLDWEFGINMNNASVLHLLFVQL